MPDKIIAEVWANVSATGPVDEDGNFEYHWLRQSGGTYPTYCANLWNVSLQGYIRE